MRRIDGKAIAARIRERVKDRVSKLHSTPGLAILLVGNDPASHVYVNLKQKACEDVGIHFEKYEYPADVATSELAVTIEKLNARPDIHGILVQLPLPSQDENAVIAAIDPRKDVDGFHPRNQELLAQGKPCLASATALGIAKLIDATGAELEGLRAAVIGSELFTQSVRILLAERGVTTDRLDPNDSLDAAGTYDILVSVVGKPGLVAPEIVKDGAIVIDVGTTRVAEAIVGDVSPEVEKEKTGWISPVPGGVGPMTVAMLLVNVLKAYQLK
ncbi:hypothetical protein A3D69_02085 [Candidatus Uhrbacteria bacterium RIFCSPHIGHO2_02_FULL_54_11]|nr:MAG: hypothetical protein A3D69_02085 [Candidatus Uhrbacteria bacterium RIFCSPHIGHO2_02_FULL_54_11]